jgi:hypothetical protein
MTKMTRVEHYVHIRVMNTEGCEEDLFLTENELHRLRVRNVRKEELRFLAPELTWRERIAKWLLT